MMRKASTVVGKGMLQARAHDLRMVTSGTASSVAESSKIFSERRQMKDPDRANTQVQMKGISAREASSDTHARSSDASMATCPFSGPTAATQRHMSSASLGLAFDAPSSEYDYPLADVRPAEEVPGPRSLPLIGTAYTFLPGIGKYDLARLEEHTMAMYQEYGPIVRDEPFPGQVIYRLFDPQDIARVFHSEGFTPSRPKFHPWLEYLKDRNFVPGLSVAEGDEWLRKRRPVNKGTLTPEVVQSYIPAQTGCAEDFVRLIRHLRDDNMEVDKFETQLHKWSAESVGVAIFDTRLGTLERRLEAGSEVTKLVESVGVLFDMLYKTQFLWPVHKSKRTKTWRAFCQSLDFIFDTSRKHVTECMRRMTTSTHAPDKTNFLMGLLASQTGELSTEEIVAIVAELLFAGTETTAYHLGFLLYNLAKFPEKQEILREEIDRIVPPGTEITKDTLDNLPYLKAVMKETHRCTPVGSYFLRVLEKDLVLSGYEVPKGSVVFPYLSVSRRLPEFFPNPDHFEPERWLERRDPVHPFTFIPFGHGPRACAGREFAKQEVAITVAKLLQNFRVEYDGEIDIICRLTNVTNKPMKFRFVDRT